MERISIFLITLNRFYSVLIGFSLGLIVFRHAGDIKTTISPFPNLFFIEILFFLAVPFLQLIAFMSFYSGENTTTKDIKIRQGIIVRDKYFPLKINSELPKEKRLIGYLYATLTPLVYIELGYLIFVLALLLSHR